MDRRRRISEKSCVSEHIGHFSEKSVDEPKELW